MERKEAMKKLLVLVALVAAVAMTMVACNNDKTPAETTGSDVTTATPESTETTAPEDDTTVPEDTTTAPEDDTTAVPEDTTTAPEDDTTAAPEDTTEEPPVVELPYVEKEIAGLINWSFDTFYVNGNMLDGDGNYIPKLEAINNTLEFPVGKAHNSIMFRGWIGFDQEIDQFGAYVDGVEIGYGDYKTPTEPGILDAGGEYATRFELPVDISALGAGTHTVAGVVKLADGTIAEIWTITVVIESPEDWDATKEDVKHVSFDEVKVDSLQGQNIKPSDKVTPAKVAGTVSKLYVWGWAAITVEAPEYAYMIDNGAIVSDPSFFYAIDPADPVVGAIGTFGGVNGERFAIAVDVAKLEGVHNIKALAKVGDKYITIAEFTIDKEAAPVDENGPTSIFGANDLVANNPTAGYDIEGATVTGNYVTFDPSGNDPYYNPFSNVKGARYLVIKYRSANAGDAYIQFYIGSTGAGPSNDDSMMKAPGTFDGEWHLMIFDLSEVPGYDGKTVSYFRFDFLEPGYILDENGQPQKGDDGRYLRNPLPEGATLDVEYVAFFATEEAAYNYEGVEAPETPDDETTAPEDTTVTPDAPATPVEDLKVDLSTLSAQVGSGYMADFAAAGYNQPIFLLGYGQYIDLGKMDLTGYNTVRIQYGCDGGDGTKGNFAALNGNAPIGLKSTASSYGQAGDYNMDGDIAHGDMVFSSNGWASGARWVEIDVSDITYNGNVYVTMHNPTGTQIAITAIEFIASVDTDTEVTDSAFVNATILANNYYTINHTSSKNGTLYISSKNQDVRIALIVDGKVQEYVSGVKLPVAKGEINAFAVAMVDGSAAEAEVICELIPDAPVVEKYDGPVRTDFRFKGHIDVINGVKVDLNGYRYMANKPYYPVIAEANGVTLPSSGRLTLTGWALMNAGQKGIYWSVDGENWYNFLGTYADATDAIRNDAGDANSEWYLKSINPSNAVFTNVYADLSAYADQEEFTVKIAVGGTNNGICHFMNVNVGSEPDETTEPTKYDDVVVDLSTVGGVDFAAAGYKAPVLQMMNWGNAVNLGSMDLSKYSKVIIVYGCDGGAKLGDVGSALRLTSTGPVADGGNNPIAATVLASATLTNPTAGWAAGDRAAVIDLSDVTYNGTVYLVHDMKDGNGIAVSSITFVGADFATDEPEVSEPTEDSSEPTEDSSEPTEDSSEPTEVSSEPTEDSSEPEVTVVDPVYNVSLDKLLQLGMSDFGAHSNSCTAAWGENNAYVTFTVTGGDPWVAAIEIDSAATVTNRMYIIYRTTAATGAAPEFFVGSEGGWTGQGDYKAGETYIADGEWHVMVVDLNGVEKFNGTTANYLRFDFFSSDELAPAGTIIDVKMVAFFNNDAEADAYISANYGLSLKEEEDTTETETTETEPEVETMLHYAGFAETINGVTVDGGWDVVNGYTKPADDGSYSIFTTQYAGVTVIDNKITITGAALVDGGQDKLFYSIDGENWMEITEATYSEVDNIGVILWANFAIYSNITNVVNANGMYNAVIDLSAYAGQTVNVHVAVRSVALIDDAQQFLPLFTFTDVAVPAVEVHECVFDNYVQDSAPTCTTPGSETATCTCGETNTREIPVNADAHKWDNGTVVPATKEAGGYTLYTCEYNAEHTYKDNFTDRLTDLQYNVAGHANAREFPAANYTCKILDMNPSITSINLGALNLANYKKVIVCYGSDGAAKFGDAGSTLSIASASGKLATSALSNATGAWAYASRTVVIDLTNVDYNGDVYLVLDLGSSTDGIAISAIFFGVDAPTAADTVINSDTVTASASTSYRYCGHVDTINGVTVNLYGQLRPADGSANYATAQGVTVGADNKITINGWAITQTGQAGYYYSIDGGTTWIHITDGTFATVDEATHANYKTHSASLSSARPVTCDSAVEGNRTNANFAMTLNLAAFEGQTLNIKIAVRRGGSTDMCHFLTLENVTV